MPRQESVRRNRVKNDYKRLVFIAPTGIEPVYRGPGRSRRIPQSPFLYGFLRFESRLGPANPAHEFQDYRRALSESRISRRLAFNTLKRRLPRVFSQSPSISAMMARPRSIIRSP